MIFGKSAARLILASASPRRAEILRNAGFEFEAHATGADETRHARESAATYVRRVATAKARAAAEKFAGKSGRTIVIGADTVVLANGKILGKPSDVKDARRMLRMLSGKTHRVLTGLAIVSLPDGTERHHVETTRVRFHKMSNAEIDDYIATDEPFGKAGAYAIQGIGGRYITQIEGCYFNVVGLPLARLCKLLTALGWRNAP
jgi:nucleoside triphosphate pyrophosphatase